MAPTPHAGQSPRTPQRPSGRPAQRPARRPRPSRATIIRRRIVALLILLALLGLIAFGLTRLVQWITADPAPAATPTPQATVTETPVPQACGAADLSVTTRAAQEVEQGQTSDVVVTLANSSAEPCTVQAGKEELVLTVSSGGHDMWSSLVCDTEPSSRPLLLDANSTADLTLTWDGTTPGVEACPQERRVAQPGTYRFAVSLDGRLGDESILVVTPASEPTTDPSAGNTDGTGSADGAGNTGSADGTGSTDGTGSADGTGSTDSTGSTGTADSTQGGEG